MLSELQNGYVARSMVSVVNNPTKLRVVTERDPSAAAAAAAETPAGKPLHPLHLALFQESGHEYTAAEGPNHGLTLDQYLAEEKRRGYTLKNAVGMTECSSTAEPTFIRVATEPQRRPANPRRASSQQPLTSQPRSRTPATANR